MSPKALLIHPAFGPGLTEILAAHQSVKTHSKTGSLHITHFREEGHLEARSRK